MIKDYHSHLWGSVKYQMKVNCVGIILLQLVVVFQFGPLQ